MPPLCKRGLTLPFSRRFRNFRHRLPSNRRMVSTLSIIWKFVKKHYCKILLYLTLLVIFILWFLNYFGFIWIYIPVASIQLIKIDTSADLKDLPLTFMTNQWNYYPDTTILGQMHQLQNVPYSTGAWVLTKVEDGRQNGIKIGGIQPGRYVSIGVNFYTSGGGNYSEVSTESLWIRVRKINSRWRSNVEEMEVEVWPRNSTAMKYVCAVIPRIPMNGGLNEIEIFGKLGRPTSYILVDKIYISITGREETSKSLMYTFMLGETQWCKK